MTDTQYWFLLFVIAWVMRTCAIKQEERYFGFVLAVLFVIFGLFGVKP